MSKYKFPKLPKLKKSQAKLVIWSSIVLSVIFVIGLIIFIGSKDILDSTFSNESRENKGNSDSEFANVYIIEGGPRIEQNKVLSRTIQDSEIVQSKNSIITDEDARAIIVLKNNSAILLDTNTKVTFNSIENSSGIEIMVVNGHIFTRVENTSDGEFLLKVNSDFSTNTAESGKFQFRVDEDQNFSPYSMKGTIKTEPKDENGNIIGQVELKDGASIIIDNGDLDKYTSDYLEENIDYPNISEKSFWDRVIDCVDAKMSDLLRGGNDSKNNYLKGKIEELTQCSKDVQADIYDQKEEEVRGDALSVIAQQQTAATKKPPTVNTVSIEGGGFTADDQIKCSWTASGDDIEGYEYSIGTSAGTTNIKDWEKTLDTKVTLTGLGMEYPNKYFCNVKASGKYGTSEVKSSGSIAFDDTEVDMDITTEPPGQIEGLITLTGITNAEDIEVSLYIKNSENKYFNGTEWVAGIFWHVVSVSGSTWTSDTNFGGNAPDYSGSRILVQAKNIKTGKIFQTLYDIP